MTINDAKVTPEQCALLFGIPTTTEEFDTLSQTSVRRDFARSQDRESIALLLKHLNATIPAIEATGMRVFRRATLDTLAEAFRLGFAVVIMFTHYSLSQRLLELADGMHDDAAIEAVIPKEHACILDLSVCRPISLADRLGFSRRGLIIRRTWRDLDAVLWAWFYLVLSRTLAQRPMPYFEAFEETIRRFLEKNPWYRVLLFRIVIALTAFARKVRKGLSRFP